jgi:hypothetical protein
MTTQQPVYERCKCGTGVLVGTAHMCEPEEPGFESVRIMRLQPGDVIVVQVRDAGNERDRDKFLARLERVFPEHKAIIVDNGAEISIARPDGA